MEGNFECKTQKGRSEYNQIYRVMHPEKFKKSYETQRRCQESNKKKWMGIIIELKYDKCVRCGYDKCFAAIDFHHIDSVKKKYNMSLILRNFFPTTEKIDELKQTVPLCSNCHRELHAGIWTLEQITKGENYG